MRKKMTINDVIDRLKAGNARFVADKLDGQLQDSRRRTALTGGQSPYAAILSCADSRVVPEFAFDAGLGELFTVRVAGNVANSSSIASLEYAIAHLDTRVIVVMGHESCGAVTAAVNGASDSEHIVHLLDHIGCARDQLQNESINDVVKRNALAVCDELTEKSAIIAKAVSGGQVNIFAAYYHLDSGEVEFLNR